MDIQVLIPWMKECQRRINETLQKEGKYARFTFVGETMGL